MAPSNLTNSKLILKFLKKHNITKVAWINARDGFGVDGLPSFEKVAKENNIDIVAHEEFDATATDMTVQLTNIRKKIHRQSLFGQELQEPELSHGILNP